MGTILISGGRVIDPANGIDSILNVLIENDRIKYVGTRSERADKIIDARGLVVTPGLIDMHVHLREPGNEEEETIASGSTAAVYGGFTTICCMPNTDPPIDTEASAEFIYLQAKRCEMANVFPIGAITKGRLGKELAEMGQLYRGGAVAFSDDGAPVSDSEVMRRGLEYAKIFNKPIISHCEEKSLVQGGVINEGYISTVLGLRGMPSVSEEIMIYRDIALARETDSRLHIAHISTEKGVELVKEAKKTHYKVTCEVTPHHLIFTEDELLTFNPNFKVNPPLRTKSDMLALRLALKDGTIDVIASDHSPHAKEEKELEINDAPFGLIGLETTLAIILTEIVNKNILSLSDAISKMTIAPATILGLSSKGMLSVGTDADITIFDPNVEWTIDSSLFKSKSRNCPYEGRKVRGKAVTTIIGGKVVKLN